MFRESLQLNPEAMLQLPGDDWRTDTPGLYSRNFGVERRPGIDELDFVKEAFSFVIDRFPASVFRFNLRHEVVSETSPPLASVSGVHTDCYAFFIACSSNPTWVDESGAFEQLAPGELAFVPGDRKHFAPKEVTQEGLRVRFKIFVDW